MADVKKKETVSDEKAGPLAFFDKNPIYIAVIAAIAVIAVTGVVLLWNPAAPSIGPTPTPTSTGSNTTGTFTPTATPVPVNPGAPKMELFVMSQCPYGVAAENAATLVKQTLGPDFDLQIHFIAKKLGGNFQSLHGDAEVAEDKRQVCLNAYAPAQFWDYLLCINQNIDNPETAWQACARDAGVPTATIPAIKDCAEGQQGIELLSANLIRSNEINATSSPTYYLNGAPYKGGRDNNTLMRNMCLSLPNNAACAALPPEPEVTLYVVNDPTCAECDATGMQNALKSRIWNLTIKTLDYRSGEGAQLVSDIGIESVPSFVLSKNLEQSYSFAGLQQYLLQEGDKYLLKAQGALFINRPAIAGKVELFVMSQCPFGTMAEKAMKEVKGALPIDYSIHYIVVKYNETFQSLHGDTEVAEDKRQVCIQAHYATKFQAYLDCVDTDITTIDSAWRGCAQGAGIDTAAVESCAASEAADLLSTDAALTEELNVQASPTLLINNRLSFSSVYAEDIRAKICSQNPGMSGCEKTLSGPTQVPSTGSAGCTG